MNWIRILVCTLALSALAAITMALSRQFSPQLVSVTPPWIGLPRTGMDARDFYSREVIVRSVKRGGTASEDESLAMRCGNPAFDDRLRERYEARIGKDAWGPFRNVRLDVVDSDIHVSVSDGEAPIAPEPVHGAPRKSVTIVAPVSEAVLAKKTLEPIRLAWSDPSLWHSPQKDAFNCLDGHPVYLEACIDGQYAARFRNCDGAAANASARLWQAVTTLLPEPRKARWQEY